MHGLVANQLRGYVVARYGREAWSNAIRASGTSLPDGPPPLDVTVADGELVAVMVSVAAAAETDIPSLLNDFGVFLAPGLLRIYAPLIQPDWRTLDVIDTSRKRFIPPYGFAIARRTLPTSWRGGARRLRWRSPTRRPASCAGSRRESSAGSPSTSMSGWR